MAYFTIETKSIDEFIVRVDGHEFPLDRTELHNLVVKINDALRHSVVVVPRLK